MKQHGTSPFTYGLDITWLAAREEQLVDEHLVSLGRRTALKRTAYLLLHLFVRAEEAGLVKNRIIQSLHAATFCRHARHVAGAHKTLKRLFVSKAIRWKDRIFEMADRAALVGIAGSDVIVYRRRPFI